MWNPPCRPSVLFAATPLELAVKLVQTVVELSQFCCKMQSNELRFLKWNYTTKMQHFCIRIQRAGSRSHLARGLNTSTYAE